MSQIACHTPPSLSLLLPVSWRAMRVPGPPCLFRRLTEADVRAFCGFETARKERPMCLVRRCSHGRFCPILGYVLSRKSRRKFDVKSSGNQREHVYPMFSELDDSISVLHTVPLFGNFGQVFMKFSPDQGFNLLRPCTLLNWVIWFYHWELEMSTFHFLFQQFGMYRWEPPGGDQKSVENGPRQS